MYLYTVLICSRIVNYGVIVMIENRYKRLVSSIDYYYCIDTTNDDKGFTEEDMLNRLNEQDERIKELQQTIDTIAKDYEESHGMDIRNAEWFTAW